MFGGIVITSVDYKLFVFFNTFFSSPFFDLIIPVVTKESNLLTLYFSASAVHIAVSKDRVTALKRVVIATLLLAVSDAIGHRILKAFFDRPRPCHPDYFINGVHVLFPQCNFLTGQNRSLSFPSNHAITNSALATIWSLWFPKAAFVLVPLASFFIFTRVYCGVHYPLDLFFGAVFGAGFGWLTYFYTKPLLVKK